MSEREWLEGLRPEDQEVASVEQEDVAAIREAISRLMIPDYEALAALDQLAAALEGAERERDAAHAENYRLAKWQDERVARAEAAERENERLREALDDIAVGRWNHGRRGKLWSVHKFARAALRPSESNDD